MKSIHLINNRVDEFSLTIEGQIKTEVFKSMLGFDTVDFPNEYDIEFNVLVQKRRHKNKRINKKWAKMYGYEIANQKSKGWHILAKSDGSIEFLK